MPESVKDRCTKAHEYIFLLTKSARYWYDNEAIKEEAVEGNDLGILRGRKENLDRNDWDRRSQALEIGIDSHSANPSGKRNKRSVWTITTKPYSGAHYAVFPPDLIEPCVLAGCPEKVCAKCGAPWERVVEKGDFVKCGHVEPHHNHKRADQEDSTLSDSSALRTGRKRQVITLGFQPTCDCDAATKPGVILDPFIGSGTTAMVARQHRRKAIGLDLNFNYLTTNARERLQYGSYVTVADGVNQLTIGV
jgi:hypothetical protein